MDLVIMELCLVKNSLCPQTRLQHFLAAISIQPKSGYSKYMYMGQLSFGLDAIQYFQTGVDIMMQELSKLLKPSEEHSALSRKISTALCSMTEIYLTDCCYEPNAEQRCEAYLNQALAVDMTNPEVYQVLSSVRLSQQRKEDAKEALEKSISLWIHVEPGHSSIPPYPTRISLVKLLLELSQYNQALTILDGLQKEDDEVIELWYLYGWCLYCMGEEASSEEEQMANWEDARDCLITCEKLFKKMESDDEDILQHTQELLQSINSVFKSMPQEDVEAENDEEWEEYNSDDDDYEKNNLEGMEM